MTIEPYVFSSAVREFWESRSRAALRQRERGASDQGTRSSVTAGRHMDGFAAKIVELMVSIGVRPNDISTRTNVESVPWLPGFRYGVASVEGGREVPG